MGTKQVIIIGGGLQGLTTANFLLDRGYEVLILEQREGIAQATSFANAGMLTPSHSTPWNHISDIKRVLSGIGKKDSQMSLNLRYLPSLLFWGLRFIRNSSSKRYMKNAANCYYLADYSKKLTSNIRHKENFNYDESINGTMKIFRSQKDFDESLKKTKVLSSLGIDFQILDSRELVLKEPQLEAVSNRINGAIYYPQDEVGDAYKFCLELEKLIKKKGGRIHTKTEIKKILVNKMQVN